MSDWTMKDVHGNPIPNPGIWELTKGCLARIGDRKRWMENAVMKDGRIIAVFPNDKLAQEYIDLLARSPLSQETVEELREVCRMGTLWDEDDPFAVYPLCRRILDELEPPQWTLTFYRETAMPKVQTVTTTASSLSQAADIAKRQVSPGMKLVNSKREPG